MTLNLTTRRGNDDKKMMRSPCCSVYVLPVLLLLFHLPPLNIHAQTAVHQVMRLMLHRQKHVSCDCIEASKFDKGSPLLPFFSVLRHGRSQAIGPLESSRKTENWDQTPVWSVFWNPVTCVRVANKERGSVSRSIRNPELTNKV